MNSNEEYVLTEHDLLMSYTDTKGIITSVNDDLVRVTGFSKEELVGNSHNMLRHSDMPSDIYADLWKTLAKQHTWTGAVKNKRKDGGFYWVRASITPIFQKEKVIGYIAIHRNTNPEFVKKTLPIYAAMKAGTFKGTIIGGQIVNNDLLSKIKRYFLDTKIKYKFLFLACLTSLSLVAFTGIDYLNANRFDDTFQATIQDVKNLSDNLALGRKAQTDFNAAMQEWENLLLHGQNGADFTAYKNAFERKNQNVLEDLTQLKSTLVQRGNATLEIDNLLTNHHENVKKYGEALTNYPNIDTIKELKTSESAAFNGLVESLDKEFQTFIAATQTKEVVAQNHISLGYALFLILSISLPLFWFTLEGIIKPLNYAKSTLRKVSQGYYLQEIETILQNELGEVLDVMRAMSVRLGSVIDMEKQAANKHLAVMIGLDNVTKGVLLADNNRKIIYTNKAAQDVLKETEDDIRRDFPDFRAAQIIGKSVDIFHENPVHYRKLLDTLQETTQIDVIIGGHNIRLTLSPVINQFGHRLGSVLEWEDRTTVLKLENQISLIVNDAINGRFNNRFDETNTTGFYKILTNDLNKLLEVCESGFDDFKRVFSNMVQGDLTEKIERQYRGDFDVLTQDANLAVLQLNTVVYDLNTAIDKVNYNIQNINEGNSNLANRTQLQTENVQQTVTAIAELKTAVDQNDEAAKYANAEVHRVFDVANKGVKVIHNVVSTMEEIHASSLKVGDIISVIDGIAFQTNILALNAAVEAARAGDQGRGFAVVASEVRNLAQMAAGAAKEIKNLITDSEEKIESGGEFVGNAGKIMQEIAASIESVTAMMTTISHACSEQSLAIERVNSAIMETENIAKQNAELVVEAANSSASLEEEMKTLSEKTAYFKVKQNTVDFQLF
jgi:methyl-accepting chemotaxis protein